MTHQGARRQRSVKAFLFRQKGVIVALVNCVVLFAAPEADAAAVNALSKTTNLKSERIQDVAQSSYSYAKEIDDANNAFKAGNINASIVQYSAIIAAGKKDAILLYNRAQAYIVLRQFKAAKEDLMQIKDDSYLSDDRFNILMGIVYAELSEFSNANQQFAKALAVKPTALAYSNRGVVFQKLGKSKEALQDFQMAAKLEASASNVYNLASAQRDAGDYRKCIINTGQIVQMENAFFYPAFTLRGICSYYLGDQDTAIADLLKSLAINGDQPEANEYLGRIMLRKAQRAQGLSYLLKAADLYLAKKNQTGYEAVMKMLTKSE